MVRLHFSSALRVLPSLGCIKHRPRSPEGQSPIFDICFSSRVTKKSRDWVRCLFNPDQPNTYLAQGGLLGVTKCKYLRWKIIAPPFAPLDWFGDLEMKYLAVAEKRARQYETANWFVRFNFDSSSIKDRVYGVRNTDSGLTGLKSLCRTGAPGPT